MSILLDSQNALKRRVMLAVLSLNMFGAIIATILHRLEPHPSPLNLIAPPLLVICSLALLIRLYIAPQSLQQVMHVGFFLAVLLMIIPSWFFTLQAFLSPEMPLVGSLPPLISGLFLILMLMMIMLRPRRLIGAAILTWGAIALPILTYFIFHPVELTTLRGLDLAIALGPAMGVQIVLILFFNRLQDLVDRLYRERLQYYEQIIERQSIRQRAMEHAVTQIHNGPLQTLALLMRDVQKGRSTDLLQRLDALNAEIRAVGHSLTDPSEVETTEHILRLGEGTQIDLNHPLHHLFHEVYAVTLKRQLPHFKTIQVKVRNFAPLESSMLTLDLKRDLCLWLEEALCNVGKHAQGVTRLTVTGQQCEDHYVLQVQDNGVGLDPALNPPETKSCTLLAQRLEGAFQRTTLPKGGVLCKLSWACRPS